MFVALTTSCIIPPLRIVIVHAGREGLLEIPVKGDILNAHQKSRKTIHLADLDASMAMLHVGVGASSGDTHDTTYTIESFHDQQRKSGQKQQKNLDISDPNFRRDSSYIANGMYN
jgi:hypothetical protein